MSLYTMSEICTGCDHSNWHQPCDSCKDKDPKFCHCSIGSEHAADGCRGTCPDKEVDGVPRPDLKG